MYRDSKKIMESQEPDSFFKKCRLCLSDPGVCDIFDTQDLQEDIYLCIGFKISPSVNLPQKLCNKCFQTINKAKELRCLAMKNELLLRSLFGIEDDNLNMVHSDDKNVIEPSSIVLNTENESQEKRKKIKSKKGINKNSSFKKKCDNEKPKKSIITIRKDLFTASSSEPVSSSSEKKRKHSDLQQLKNEVKKILHNKNGNEEIDFECEICNKSFDKWKKFYLHSRLHNKNIHCPLDCGKSFASKSDLEKHTRTHTGEKPFQCDICDKSYTQNGTLKLHKEKVHS